MKMPALLFFVLAVCDWQLAAGDKMLMISPMGSKSHTQFFGEIARTLADRGHQMTVITSHGTLKHPNITYIDAKMPLDDIMPNSFNMSMASATVMMLAVIPPLCLEILGRKEIQDIRIEEYDLVFISAFMTDCFFPLLDEKDVPFIIMSPNTIVTILHDMVGNVDFPSFVPVMGVTATYPLTFLERILNTCVNLLSHSITRLFYIPKIARLCKEAEYCKHDGPFLMETASKSSLMFINSVRSLEVPARPYVPAVVHAGGLNCRPAKPLPQDLQSWIEDSGDAGVIYFSLGSAVKPADMSEKHRKILVNVFASLPQRVLWKWHEETMQDLPANVKLSKWLPQQDILGHPKVKLFISHGGIFSIFETTYHGVPILGMPVFADQTTNIERVVHDGYGERLDWAELSENLLREKIEALLTDKRYPDIAKQRSALMRDQPMSPQDTVVYWTEYVIRHKGAPHLRSPVIDMPWYKVYNMDVWAVLLVGLLVLVTLLVLIIKCVVMRLRKLCFRGQVRSEEKRQTKIKKN